MECFDGEMWGFGRKAAGMIIDIRSTQGEDYSETEDLAREAFWNLYAPGACEHFLVHRLRKSPSYVKTLDFVAVSGDRIVGNIVFTRSSIRTETGDSHETLTFGPVCVTQQMRGKGIGGTLIKHSLAMARHAGHGTVVIFGNPDYFKRFGFKSGRKLGLCTAVGTFSRALLALELHPGALEGVNGRVHMDPAFDAPDPRELKKFDKKFVSRSTVRKYAKSM